MIWVVFGIWQGSSMPKSWLALCSPFLWSSWDSIDQENGNLRSKMPSLDNQEAVLEWLESVSWDQ